MDDKTSPPHTRAQLKQEAASKFVPEKAKPADTNPRYTPEQIKFADDHIGIIQLVSGITAKNEGFFAYVKVRPSRFEEFVRKMVDGERMDVEDYGKVLKKGFGKEPSDDIKSYMEETFGVDHDYMQHVIEAYEKLQQEKSKK